MGALATTTPNTTGVTTPPVFPSTTLYGSLNTLPLANGASNSGGGLIANTPNQIGNTLYPPTASSSSPTGYVDSQGTPVTSAGYAYNPNAPVVDAGFNMTPDPSVGAVTPTGNLP